MQGYLLPLTGVSFFGESAYALQRASPVRSEGLEAMWDAFGSQNFCLQFRKLGSKVVRGSHEIIAGWTSRVGQCKRTPPPLLLKWQSDVFFASFSLDLLDNEWQCHNSIWCPCGSYLEATVDYVQLLGYLFPLPYSSHFAK